MPKDPKRRDRHHDMRVARDKPATKRSRTVDNASPPIQQHEHNQHDSPLPAVDIGSCSHVSSRYEKLSRIGQGTYGIVYKARDRQTQQLVALKKCIPHYVSSDGFPLTTLRELTALRLLRHEHIVQLLDISVSSSSSSVFLVFEYCDHELGQLIDAHYDKHQCSPFSEAATKTLMRQLLSALRHLHAHNYVHRDVKLSNLLYTAAGKLKVADFGLARPRTIPMTPTVASLWYRPPELLWLLAATESNNSGDHNKDSPVPHYDQSMDLWAAACVYCEFMLGTPPMCGRNELEQIGRVIEFVGLPPRDMVAAPIELPATSSPRTMLGRFSFLSIDGLRFLTGLLEYDPAMRWTAQQALDCVYLTSEYPLPLAVEQMPRFGAATAVNE